jgi:predicted esterase
MKKAIARIGMVALLVGCATMVCLTKAYARGDEASLAEEKAAASRPTPHEETAETQANADAATAAQQQTAPKSAAISAGPQTPPDARALLSQLPKFPGGTVYAISPADADPQVKRFLSFNLVLFKNDVKRNAPLLVYFSGTNGTPASGWPFLETAAHAGYRVIGLEYDDHASVPQTCGPNPDPACSDRFRQKRIFGDDVTKDIDDLPEESVVNRLTKTLDYLNAHYHDENWGRYLRHGQPNWPAIAFAGHSQGAGVAAYIAKKKKVARVIVLSGAWDRAEPTKTWAPWVLAPSATPMSRWYAAYHARESRAQAMKEAYVALKIPADHVRVLMLAPNPKNKMSPRSDVYHVSMVAPGVTPLDANGNPAYAADWEFMLGMAK